MKYLLPKTDEEFLDLCELEQFKGRHNVIMSTKYYIRDQGGNISLDDFMRFVQHYNKKGWKNWC